ncbi:MAG: tetratricopeptide repeat protein [Proteobacteria bacterium]|nr:tetratricopeptide repeat protein [Pseudomonadota bacterium]
MSALRFALAAVLLASSAILTAKAGAQDLMFERFIRQCNDADHGTPPQQAIYACTQMIRSNLAIGHPLAVLYNSRALHHLDLHEDDEALSDFTRAIFYSPRYAQAYVNRALLEMVRHHFPEAVADYGVVVSIIPNNQIGYSARCWARALWGQELEQARADCEAALRISPHRVGALEGMGLIDLREQRFSEAHAVYDEAVAANPANARVRYGRGIAALRLGRLAEGRGDLAAAAEIDNRVAETFEGYGVTP